jgi:four helix bundle protein
MKVKHQTPNTKLQRSSKHQAPDVDSGQSSVVTYKPAGKPEEDWMLRDGPLNGGAERHSFDLEERTARLGEAIIRFSKKIPRDPTNNRLIDQLVGCSTSAGANECVSKKDFRINIARCVKEAKETKFFLRMLAASEPGLADEARDLYREAKELHLIFASMFRKADSNQK